MKRKIVLLVILFAGLSWNNLSAQPGTSAPVATIAGKNGGKISKEELTKAEKVLCTGNYTVTEFKFSVAGKGIDYKEFQGRGEFLTPEMISAVQMIPPGGKVFIEYIRANPEGSEATRQISPLDFTLTE